MKLRKLAFTWAVLALAATPMVLAQQATKALPALSAEQIVSRNVNARGGLQAWRAVNTLSQSGKLQVGGNYADLPIAMYQRGKGHRPPAPPAPKPQVELPYAAEFKRPGKQRIEVVFAGQTAVQVFDGTHGWKLRPFLNRHEVEAFTAEEMQTAALQSDLDGPLIDYLAKGSKVALAGTEKVGGRNTYKITLTTKSGHVQHIWIDTQTFLEAKMEGAPHRMDGKPRTTEIYLRDFRKVSDIVMPFETETATIGYRDTHKMSIDKAIVNPPIADSRFAKPQ